jgi:PST family polysaccharide transporter
MNLPKNYKSKLIKGGLFVTARQLLASIFSLVNALIVAKILGPSMYGIVAVSMGIFYFLKWTFSLGMHIYVVRQPELQKSEVEEILAFYNTIGILACGLLWIACPVFSWWTNIPELTSILRVLIPAIWLHMISGLSISLMERELRFDESSLIDAIAQIINYCFSIPLVLLNWGYWGPTLGTLLQFICLALLAAHRSPLRWRFHWKWSELKRALKYGLSFYASDWIFSLRSLTIPMIVTPLGGPETAGIVNITLRIVRQLTLLRLIVRRMSISVVAKMLDEPRKLLRMITKMMSYQALMMGLICSSFACLSAWLIPAVFGNEWIASSTLFPFMAFAEMVGAVFDLHNSTLYAAGQNQKVAFRNLIYISILWSGTALFLPLIGIVGYGLAEILAIPSYYVIHVALKKLCGFPRYQDIFWMMLASIPGLFGSLFLGWISGLLVFASSYLLLFTLNKEARSLVVELLHAIRLKEKFS